MNSRSGAYLSIYHMYIIVLHYLYIVVGLERSPLSLVTTIRRYLEEIVAVPV
jgi:hypothetical protein